MLQVYGESVQMPSMQENLFPIKFYGEQNS